MVYNAKYLDCYSKGVLGGVSSETSKGRDRRKRYGGQLVL